MTSPALAKIMQEVDRQADEAQSKAAKVHVCTTVHGAPGGPRYTVLIDGEYYVVNHPLLIALRRGRSPADLELEPAEPEEAADDAFGIPSPDSLRRWHHTRVL